jgi:hypothetical protein
MGERNTTAWCLGALLFAAVSIPAATAAQAASISVDPYIVGGTRISFRGEIVRGDEQRFRAIADRVSDGNVVVVAIGRTVRERGFMTMVWPPAGCASCLRVDLARRPACRDRVGLASWFSCAGLRGW